MRMRHLLALALCGLISTGAQALERVEDFGSNPGSLRMDKYVPANLPAKAPLVVTLHGCTQSASDYDDEPGWPQIADRHGFALLLPSQSTSNQELGCFSWFEPGDQKRGKGSRPPSSAWSIR
jgi:poly(3-hydroxybutyrate) depolymerase